MSEKMSIDFVRVRPDATVYRLTYNTWPLSIFFEDEGLSIYELAPCCHTMLANLPHISGTRTPTGPFAHMEVPGPGNELSNYHVRCACSHVLTPRGSFEWYGGYDWLTTGYLSEWLDDWVNCFMGLDPLTASVVVSDVADAIKALGRGVDWPLEDEEEARTRCAIWSSTQ